MADKPLPSISEHTPEPWFINGTLITFGRIAGGIVGEARLDAGPNWWANAKLFRAAPALLRELKQTADDLELMCEKGAGSLAPLRTKAEDIRRLIASLDDPQTWMKDHPAADEPPESTGKPHAEEKP